MNRQTIKLSTLFSPKQQLNYNKRNKYDFYQLVIILKTKRKLDLPIEVYPWGNGRYYIADGVHRAKAAELAGLDEINAVVYTDSRPTGQAIPLKDVIV